MVYSAHNDGEIQGAKQLSSQERQCGGDLKPYHFAEFLQIRDSDCQVHMLEELAKGTTDLKNFKEECKAIIKRRARQVQFMKELCIPDWKTAEEEYPLHTTAAAMDRFEGLNFNKALHDVWRDHITSAKKYKELGTGRNCSSWLKLESTDCNRKKYPFLLVMSQKKQTNKNKNIANSEFVRLSLLNGLSY